MAGGPGSGPGYFPAAAGRPGVVVAVFAWLRPEVVGPSGVPRIVEPAVAERAPHLAVLSAVAHGRGPGAIDVLTAAFAAMEGFDDVSHTLCTEMIWAAMDAAARGAVQEAMMSADTKLRGYDRPIWREMFPQLIDECEQRGRIVEARRALHSVLEARGLAADEAQRARIEGCGDTATLEAWLRRAVVAVVVADVFGE